MAAIVNGLNSIIWSPVLVYFVFWVWACIFRFQRGLCKLDILRT